MAGEGTADGAVGEAGGVELCRAEGVLLLVVGECEREWQAVGCGLVVGDEVVKVHVVFGTGGEEGVEGDWGGGDGDAVIRRLVVVLAGVVDVVGVEGLVVPHCVHCRLGGLVRGRLVLVVVLRLVRLDEAVVCPLVGPFGGPVYEPAPVRKRLWCYGGVGAPRLCGASTRWWGGWWWRRRRWRQCERRGWWWRWRWRWWLVGGVGRCELCRAACWAVGARSGARRCST